MSHPRAPRRLAILTGGGDCPGLNAVIRAVAKSAIRGLHAEVLGVEDGFLGLVENRVRHLTDADVSGVVSLGGTLLGSSNRCNPRKYHPSVGTNHHDHVSSLAPPDAPIDVTDRCLATLRAHRVDALVVVGGDGTMTIAEDFAKQGVRVIGVPKTIDNDLPCTDLTFGFLTAVATATDALDRVHTTGKSHHRAMVVETMGRNAGWLALFAGVASGADVILLPEIPFSLESVCATVAERQKGRKGYSILAIAEGAKPAGGMQTVARFDPTSPDPVRLGGIGALLGKQIEDRTGVETRITVLGHIQRGGAPIAADRVLATQFGAHAVQLLEAGATSRLVVWREGRVSDVPLADAAGKQRLVPLDDPLIAAARAIGTSFGD